MAAVRFTRTLRPGMSGVDVEGVGRALARAGFLGGLPKFVSKMPGVRRRYGPAKTRAVKNLQAVAGLKVTGVYNNATHRELVRIGGFDPYAASLMMRWKAPPALVEPRQGWTSLHRSLWRVYSVGRGRYGFVDLGTYNPASRLPGSGAPSDHAVYPAMAFDLGISPATGWAHLKARAYVLWVAHQPEIEYVILGDRIYFGALSWRKYTSGGHLNHIHVSGHR